VQVGTRQIKTIERIVLPSCVKQGRSERRPKRTPNRVQNPRAKIKKRLTIIRGKRFLHLVKWDLLVVDRLRSLFANPEDAKLMS